MGKAVCVFCGANPGNDPQFGELAERFGALLAQKGLRLVYGGGKVGLMGAVANGSLAKKGKVTGVIPKFLVDKEIAHNRLNELLVVATMHERKKKMADLADAFVALPGGMGTLEELFEVLTWAQLGLHRKPIVVLNVAGFFDPLLTFLDQATQTGFIRREHRQLVLTATTEAEALQVIDDFQPVEVDKWLVTNREA
jgi:uncharacterized protein (TIGR00730 family)